MAPAPPHGQAARPEPVQPIRDLAVSGAAAWTCPGCTASVTTPFCATCGEEPPAPRDLTLRGLAAKLIHAGTSIDARAIRTARRLLRQPGELTSAWLRGVRKPYVAPFQLFLIANVTFFALQWLTGETVLSSSLESHLHHQDWSALAQSLVSAKLESTHTTLELYTPVFDRAVVVNAKSLILLMTLPRCAAAPGVLAPASTGDGPRGVLRAPVHVPAALLLPGSRSSKTQLDTRVRRPGVRAGRQCAEHREPGGVRAVPVHCDSSGVRCHRRVAPGADCWPGRGRHRRWLSLRGVPGYPVYDMLARSADAATAAAGATMPDVEQIDALVGEFFRCFDNRDGRVPSAVP